MKAGGALRFLVGAFLALSLAFLGYGVVRYFSPPHEPQLAPVTASDTPRDGRSRRVEYSLERYSVVAGGRMFLGETAGAASTPPAASAFIVRAIFPGPNARAVLAPAGEPPEGRSWVVKVGDVVEGERVLGISNDYVTLQIQGQRVRIAMAE